MGEMDFRPSRIEVSRSAFRANIQAVREAIGRKPKIMAVVKSNAYGHGMVELAREALVAGAEALGVATSDEALELRECADLRRVPLLVMGPLLGSEIEPLLKSDVAITAGSASFAEEVLRKAQSLSIRPRIHHQVDTGIGRDGSRWSDLSILNVYTAQPEALEGIFTHFAVSDSLADEHVDFTNAQIFRFQSVVDEARKKGLSFDAHAANSGAIMYHPSATFDMVRPGMMLYGAHPDNNDESPIPLQQVATFKSAIAVIRTMKSGETISYGRLYTCAGERRIAILPIGYGDGYPRLLSNKFSVLLRGERVPIRGRVCMDQIMIDVTDLPDAQVGDEVVLYGAQQGERITLEEVARAALTIPYELTCSFTKRVRRHYVD